MKFLLIASFPESIVSFRGALIRSLLEQGLSVFVAAPGLSAGSLSRIEVEATGATVIDIPLNRTSTNPIGDIRLAWHLFRLMRRIRPDAVLGYTIKPVIYGSLAAWLVRVPRRFALVTGLGYAFTGSRSGFLASVVKWLYGRALAKVNKVFVQNPDDESLIRDHGILPKDTPAIVVNGSGIDLSEYCVQPLSTDPVHFLMIARLLGDKGVREYVRAAQRVKSQYPEVRCSLVGWIDENPDAVSQEELDSWIGDGFIEYCGRVHDVRPVIAECSVYVLPSYREGTPRTVLEAMSIGRPIITTDAPGCRETVVDSENGFLVPTKSVDAVAKAMCRFVDMPELVATMGRRSREIAEEKYDVRKVNELMIREMGL